MYIFQEKKDKLFANSGDPDQMLRSAASDLGLHLFANYLLAVSRIQRVKLTVKVLIRPQCCAGCTGPLQSTDKLCSRATDHLA